MAYIAIESSAWTSSLTITLNAFRGMPYVCLAYFVCLYPPTGSGTLVGNTPYTAEVNSLSSTKHLMTLF